MNDMQYSSEREAAFVIDEEDEFLQELADLEYEEFYQQELERDERAREKEKE